MLHLIDKYFLVEFCLARYRRSKHLLLVAAILVLPACGKYKYIPEPIDPVDTYQQNSLVNHNGPDFQVFLQKNAYPTSEWPLQSWDLHSLTLASLYFNPALKVASSRIEIGEAEQRIAGQRQNPTVNAPFEYRTEDRGTPWLYGLVVDFLFQRADKREAAVAEAAAKTHAAEIELERLAWQLYIRLLGNFIDYFYSVRTKDLLLQQEVLLEKSLGLLEKRLEFGQASEFELSSLRLGLQQIQLRLSNQDYFINDAFYNLVANTGLQADKFNKEQFIFDDLQTQLFRAAQVTDSLQAELLHNNYQIRVMLAEYNAFEARLKLEIIKQYPDINLSPGFIYEQGDNIWTLGAAWVLPLFHNNEGQIERALAQRRLKQAEFLELQTRLINQLDRKRQNFIDKFAAYQNSLTMVNTLQDRAKQIEKQFQLGYSDSLSLYLARLEIEKARQAIFEVELDVMRAAADIEAITQKSLSPDINVTAILQTMSVQDNEQ